MTEKGEEMKEREQQIQKQLENGYVEIRDGVYLQTRENFISEFSDKYYVTTNDGQTKGYSSIEEALDDVEQ